MKKKRSVCLLISAILGIIYAIYIVSYFFGINAEQTVTSEAVGAGIATVLVAPHMVCVTLAVVFNVIGWVGNIRWAALVGAILYAVSMLLFFIYAMFVIIQMILSFVGFARMKKRPVQVEVVVNDNAKI